MALLERLSGRCFGRGCGVQHPLLGGVQAGSFCFTFHAKPISCLSYLQRGHYLAFCSYGLFAATTALQGILLKLLVVAWCSSISCFASD
jgi:hypothetical protein